MKIKISNSDLFVLVINLIAAIIQTIQCGLDETIDATWIVNASLGTANWVVVFIYVWIIISKNKVRI